MPPTAAVEETERKFINPTTGYVGASKLDGDGKWTAVPVEPNGGAVWLTPAEERKTAEATRLASDNPFIKEWEEPVEWDGDGQVTRTVTRTGMLVLAPEGARPIASDRFIPSRVDAPVEAQVAAAEHAAARPDHRITVPEGFKVIVHKDGSVDVVAQEEEPEPASEPEPEPAEETQTGAPPLPEQPPVEGQPSPDEIVGTPEAVAANDKALAEREPTAEQPTRPSEAIPV